MSILTAPDRNTWTDVCALEDITLNTGVCAWLEGQQIAIFRVASEQRVYALSNLDPFSQAYVMSRGIIGDIVGERVVASPIYKQHFSLSTGRCLEDQQYKLTVYPSKIEQGRVMLSSHPQKTYMTNNGQQQEKLKLVLVGNGLAGMRCLEDVLEMAPDRYEITVIGAEKWGNYNRVLLSPVLSGEKLLDDILLHTPAWYQDKNIRFIAEDAAVRIDRPRKQVHTQSARVIDYDRLILATGSQPFIPDIAGTSLKGVMSFRNIDDVQRMLDYTKSHRHAVVIGAGLLGLEAAYGLLQRGMQVTVVHLMDRIMERQLDAQASQMLQRAIETQGIRVVTGAETEKLIGIDGQVQQVQLKDGSLLTADLVVFAVGIRPNIALAQSAGLRCNRGVLVNDTMQSYDPSIYAVGECTEYRGQTYGLVEPLWGQALVCASHLAEHGRLSFQSPTVATQLKVSACEVFSAGVFEPEQAKTDIVFMDEKRQIYKRLIIKNDRLVGVVLFGDSDDAAWYAELIASQTVIAHIRHSLLFGQDFALKHAG